MSGLGEIKRCLKCGGEMENLIFGYICLSRECKRNRDREKKLEQERREEEK